MLRISLTIRSADDIPVSLEKLQASIEAANISTESKAFLVEASSRTLELWRSQLERVNTKSLKANKVFDGSDYRVDLRVRSAIGVIGSFKRALGLA